MSLPNLIVLDRLISARNCITSANFRLAKLEKAEFTLGK